MKPKAKFASHGAIASPAAAPAAARRRHAPIAFDGVLTLRRGAAPLGGADRVALLEAIDTTGSMTAAARAVGISYKTAWDRVEAMNNGAGRALVERSSGGVGGGGSRLTPYARELIHAFRAVEATHAQVVDRLSRSIIEPDGALRGVAALGLRTSARNQLAGTVVEVRRGVVNALVVLALPGGDDRIDASLTLASLDALGLAVGVAAVALIKAPSVFVVLDEAGGAPARLSVGNALGGKVVTVAAGAVNTEVQARLAGGQTMVAMLSAASAERLNLRPGAAVRLLFTESSVIVGVV